LAHKLLLRILNSRGPKVNDNDDDKAAAEDDETTVRYQGNRSAQDRGRSLAIGLERET
jgi:hypothetical protein